MPEKYVLVEHSSAINNIIRHTFQTTQRIKFTAFDVSPKYIIFGANSGGIYIFTREPCQFLKLIPSTHGPTNLLQISPNQENLAIATNTGLVIILEGCFNQYFEQQVFTEHEGHTVTAMIWNGNDLYCGDSTGRVSVITFKNFLAMFQTPVACLMHLDSQIVQLDTYLKFLLVSTQTRTLLCDTETERYRQVGKKLRDGHFGACFLHRGVLQEVVDVNRVWGAFKTVSENEELSVFDNKGVKIYCARPGARLWEGDFQANVVVTHQFRQFLSQKPSDVIESGDLDELKKKSFEGSTIGDNFNFGKIFPLLDKFIICFKDDGFYVFDPSASALLHWSDSIKNIKDVKIVDSFLYIWHNDLEVSVVALMTVEELILRSLIRKKYKLCGELCVEFLDELQSLIPSSKKIHLISALESKLEAPEVLAKLSPIFQQLKESARTPSLEKFRNGIVTVNALPMLPESVQNFEIKEKDATKESLEEKDATKKSLSIISEQYKINKIEKNIETADFTNLIKTLDPSSLYDLIEKFQKETPDCESWCKEIFLKSLQTVDIPSTILDYACQAFLQMNSNEELLCKCDFPLPQVYRTPPSFYEIGCQLMEKTNCHELFLKKIPYMYKCILTKLESISSDLPLMIQFSDLEILQIHSRQLTYDMWDESIRFLLKLKTGQCLNCGSNIDPTDSFKWTEFAVIMVQSIKPTNTIKLFKRYSNLIPKGELDRFFYQYCILSAVIDVKHEMKKVLTHDATKGELDASMSGFLRRKYLRGEDHYDPSRDKLDNCDHCQLPLKVQVLEIKKLTCGHNYHKVCFLFNEGQCSICGPVL